VIGRLSHRKKGRSTTSNEISAPRGNPATCWGPGGKGCVGCSFGFDHMGCLVHLEHDYHVSFTPEELAKGEVYYNYRMTDGGMEA
jgi:predicted dithiol-disulfide oxidoreductase (DUF899 family)